MSIGVTFVLLFTVLGGLALFIFGMSVMTEGLRRAVGGRLRAILKRTTRNTPYGLALGTLLGLLVHSSGVSVLLVGFVNAGLMTLMQSIPVVLGANVGTTLSMQLISFRIGEFSYFIITVGFIVRMAGSRPVVRDTGSALFGFGLLFLGMTIMSDAVKPYRDDLVPLLSGITSQHMRGLLLGIGISALVTAVIQSSGATIGMCFALIKADVFTSIDQTFPIVLGAHIGTCATALLSSVGTNIQARRCAFSHLAFNLFNVMMALIAMPVFLWLMPLTSHDLLRQTANLHSAVMLSAMLILWPFMPHFARLIATLVRSRRPDPIPSFLDQELLDYPEKALAACIRELQRVARIGVRSLMLSAETVLFSHDRRVVTEIKMNERSVNEVKMAMKEYLGAMTHRYLSRRQAILIQHLDRCMIDLERIGDHIDSICDLSLRRQRIPGARVDKESLDMLFDLYAKTLRTFRLVIESLNPDQDDFQRMAERILKMRDDYVLASMNTKAAFTEKVAQRVITPLAGFFFNEYISGLDRIVRHSKSIALAERQPQFWIKRKKLDRPAAPALPSDEPTTVNPRDYLDRLQSEEYL